MTITEKYYQDALELKRQDPEIELSDLIRILKYKGNKDSFRVLISNKVNRELGIKHKKTAKRPHIHLSADEKISTRPDMERFGNYDEYGEPYETFTDGYYIDPSPVELTSGRTVLVMNDHHIGIHSTKLCEAPIYHAKQRGNIDTIIINGDLLDFAGVSSHAASPYEKMHLKDEIAQGKAYLNWVRMQFPKAEIVYAEGNHEYRLSRYIACNAKQFDGIIFLERLLGLNHLGIQFVPYHKHVKIGHQNIMHGHHIKGSGVNVAATLLAKSGVNIMFGDRHRSQEAFKRRFDGTTIGAWAVGCLCPLSVSYSLNNPDWINGFAYLESYSDGTFEVENKKMIDGKIR